MSLVQSKSGSAASTGTHSLVMDGAPTNGSLLVAGVVVNALCDLTAAGSWTKLHEVDSTNITFGVFYKIAGAGESTTQTVCTSSVNGTNGIIIAERATPDGTLGVTSDAIADILGAVKTSPSITPSANGRITFGYAAAAGNRTWTLQNIGGSTSVTDLTQVSQSGRSCDMWYLEHTPDGATGFTAESTDSSSNDNGGAAIMSFRVTDLSPPAGGSSFRKTLLGVGA